MVMLLMVDDVQRRNLWVTIRDTYRIPSVSSS